MADSIGSLVVSLSAETAAFESAMTRAAYQADQSLGRIATSVESAAASFSLLKYAVEAIIFSSIVQGLANVVESTIDAQAHLVDLGTKAGTTASAISSLIPAAKLSGTSLDDVASISDKFSKNLVGLADGTGKGVKAFADLGFGAEDAARFLKDPVHGLFELSQHLNQYADDGNKVADVQLIVSKGAAALLPFFKQLGDQTELTSRVTDEQAAAAHQLEDEWRLLQLRSDELKNAIAAELVPVLLRVAEGFLISRQAGLGWYDSLTNAGLTVEGLGRTMTDVRTQIDAFNERLALARSKDLSSPYIFGPTVRKDIEDTTASLVEAQRQLSVLKSIQAQRALDFAASLGDLSDQVSRQYQKPKPSLPRASSGGGGGTDFSSFVDQAQKELTNAQIAFDDLGNSIDAQTSPAMKRLIDLLGDPKFLQAPQVIRDQVQAILLDADAVEHATASEKAYQELQTKGSALLDELAGKSLDFSSKFAANLAILDALLDKNIISIEQYDEALGKLVNQQYGKGGDQIAAEVLKINEAYQKFLDGIDKSNEKQRLQLSLLGQSPELIARANAEFTAQEQVQTEINLLTDQWVVAVSKGQGEAAQALLDKLNDILDRQQGIVTAAGDTATAYARASKEVSAWQDIFRSVADTGAKFIVDFVQHGSSAFRNLWDDFKNFALETFAKIAAQQLVISIAGAISPQLGALASNTLGGGNTGLLSLLNGGGGGGLFGSFATSGIGQGLGLSSSVPFNDALGDAASEGVGAISRLTNFGSALSGAVPFLGLAIGGLSLLSGLFGGGKPSPTQGQFQIGGGGFEDNVSATSQYGAIGFADQGTKYFSGAAAQAFDQVVASTLNAFTSHLSTAQQSQLSTNLQSTVFPASTGGSQSTDDFIKQYGGQILQQVVKTAFDVLDPAFGNLVANFHGTNDELADFANSLLALHDQLAALPPDIASKLESGLTADNIGKISAFATAYTNIQKVLAGNPLADALASIDAQSKSATTAFFNQATALRNLITNFDGSAIAATNLATATNQYYAAEVQLLAQLEQVKASLSTLFGDTVRSITLQTLDKQGQYNFLQTEAEGLRNQLLATSDPALIQTLAQNINRDISQAFGLLTPEDQQAQLATYTANINALNAEISARLTSIQGDVQTAAGDVMNEAATRLSAAVDAMTAAANVDLEASQNNLTASQTPIDITVNVNTTGTSEVTG